MNYKILLLALITYSLALPVGFLFAHLFGVVEGTPSPGPVVSSSTISLPFLLLELVVSLVVGVVVLKFFGLKIFKYYGYVVLFFWPCCWSSASSVSR